MKKPNGELIYPGVNVSAPVTKAGEPVSKAVEIGATGLQRMSNRGLVEEEFLTELSGERGRRIFREMRSNDGVCWAILFAIDKLVRNASWNVEDGSDEAREFVDSCFQDTSQAFDHSLSEILTCLPYGWSWHETVYKRRNGESLDPSKNSKYNDGKIGWRKFAPRSQHSLFEWVWDKEGGLQALVQVPAPDYKRREIPINKSLLFRIDPYANNPEGTSILRGAYRSWYFLKRIQDIEGVGIERDLAGLPAIYRAKELEIYDAQYEQILRQVRRDSSDGLILPLVYDADGKELFRFQLMSSPGARQIDVGATIIRYEQSIARTVLADFIMLGQQAVGSFALADSKTNIFSLAIGALTKSIAEVFNRHAIPRLLRLNGFPLADAPRLVPGDVESPDLKDLAAFLTALSGCGMELFPDDTLDNHLRRLAHLPPKPEGEMLPAQLPPKPAEPSPTEDEEDITGDLEE